MVVAVAAVAAWIEVMLVIVVAKPVTIVKMWRIGVNFNGSPAILGK